MVVVLTLFGVGVIDGLVWVFSETDLALQPRLG